MNEMPLIMIALLTVLMAGLGLYMRSRPNLPTREERERSETLKALKRIEEALSRNAVPELPASWEVDVPPDALIRHNREAVKHAEVCACLQCLAIFPPGRIRQWRDDGTTACCPACASPMVVAESQTAPLTVNYLLRIYRALSQITPRHDPKVRHGDDD